MEVWAHRKNIERFEAKLRSEVDPRERQRLEELLDLERGRLAEALSRRGDRPPLALPREFGPEPSSSSGS